MKSDKNISYSIMDLDRVKTAGYFFLWKTLLALLDSMQQVLSVGAEFNKYSVYIYCALCHLDTSDKKARSHLQWHMSNYILNTLKLGWHYGISRMPFVLNKSQNIWILTVNYGISWLLIIVTIRATELHPLLESVKPNFSWHNMKENSE